ncbi:MAG TPA: prepilin-type N-terminal cleavage/methylation domain-containing protein, partial [Labilithrix sp.]|nr:prepilin-type N-terminal cleavage/methylation domain-containing protein [Labilithrix sp.]
MIQGRKARRRRAASRGFTLMELMVVVVLVALLALLASPSFSEARNDRLAFDYSRQFQQILVQGRSRAAGTGAAHLALFGPGAGSPPRGYVRLYAALDGLPATGPGPNPVSSCKLDPVQWDQAQTDPPNLTGNKALFIDFAEINPGGVNKDMDVRATFWLGSGSVTTTANVAFLAICITPSGVTYVGDGATANDAI